jgi:RsiW-degrading membrane proteinase PrsW (M82 family)
MFLPELVPGAIVGAAIAPALLLLWLAVAADSRPEPPRVVWLCVGLGAIVTMPVGMLEVWLMAHLPLIGNQLLAAYEAAMLIAAIPEETAKIAIIAAVALRSRDFDEPMDGVVYGAAVGLGFAAAENIFYLAGSGTGWESLAILRGLLTVPFHGALGAIAGAYLARARFSGVLGAHRNIRWHRLRMYVLAWLVPVVLHSLFDGLAMWQQKAAADAADTTAGAAEILALALVMLVVGLGAMVFAVRLARRIAHRQKAWLHTKRLPPADWRGVWAMSMIGVGLSCVAGALVVTGNSAAHIAGWVLIAVAVGISWACRKYLSAAAKHRRHPLPAPSS